MIVKNDDFTITIYDNRLDGSVFRYSATVLQPGTKEAKAIKALADRVAALEIENAATKSRAEKAEAMVERLIEAGDYLASFGNNRPWIHATAEYQASKKESKEAE